MKNTLRKICWPILRFFEKQDDLELEKYDSSHRTILLAVGVLFFLLGVACAAVIVYTEQYGAFLPALVFLCVGTVSLVVGALGSNRAVARIWRSD